ncbi:hypothetical protein VQ056_20800 [Paenibacillus sp. JTLBN-2024]
MVRWKRSRSAMAEQGKEVISKLLEHGHEAYWVGGCVGDELMGEPVDDMDITTSALPEEVQDVFERTVPTGIQHGTVTVLSGDCAFEVTTYRVEGAYEKHRRPAGSRVRAGFAGRFEAAGFYDQRDCQGYRRQCRGSVSRHKRPGGPR